MTQPAYQLGIKASLFRNTSTYNSPVWSEITGISDFKVAPDWKAADGSTRASRVERSVKTLLGLTFVGKIKVDHNDANYLALLAALYADTILDVMAIDGDPTDSTLTGTLTGWRFDTQVYKGDQSQGLTEVLFDDFELKPTLSANPACFVSAAVTAGSPVYTYTTV